MNNEVFCPREHGNSKIQTQTSCVFHCCLLSTSTYHDKIPLYISSARNCHARVDKIHVIVQLNV